MMAEPTAGGSVRYEDVYTNARGGSVVSMEQLIFMVAVAFIAGIFLLICFAGTILITRWMMTGNSKSKNNDDEEHCRMRQEVTEWKLAQDRMRADFDRKLDRDRDSGARKSPSTVIKIDQPPAQPPTIIERGSRECHASTDMTQIMNLLGQRPLIQTVFSQPSVPMQVPPMPMPQGYNPYAPPPMMPQQQPPFQVFNPSGQKQPTYRQSYQKPQESSPQPPTVTQKTKKSHSASPPKYGKPPSIAQDSSTLHESMSSPKRQRKPRRQSYSRSQTHSKSPACAPDESTETKSKTEPETTSTFTSKYSSDLPELTGPSGDNSASSLSSVSSRTSDLTEFSDVPPVKHRKKTETFGQPQGRRSRSRSRSRTPKRTATPNSYINSDLTEFSDSSRKRQPRSAGSTVSSLSSVSSMSSPALKPAKTALSTPASRTTPTTDSSSMSPQSLAKSVDGSADSTLSVEMSPQAEKRAKIKPVELQFKPQNATATMMTLAKYHKTRDRRRRNEKFELVPVESDSPVSTTDLGTSISTSATSSTTATPQVSPPKQSLRNAVSPTTTTSKLSPPKEFSPITTSPSTMPSKSSPPKEATESFKSPTTKTLKLTTPKEFSPNTTSPTTVTSKSSTPKQPELTQTSPNVTSQVSPPKQPQSTLTSPTTATWTRRPPPTDSTPSTTSSKISDPLTSGASNSSFDSPIEKLPVSPKATLRSADSPRPSSPEMRLDGTQNDESEKQLRRNVPVNPNFASGLVETLARHGKADHKKQATWRYQFVPEIVQKSPKSLRLPPKLVEPELNVDVTQEDDLAPQKVPQPLRHIPVHPKNITGVIHSQATGGKFNSTTFAVNEQFVIVPEDEGFRTESRSSQSKAIQSATSTVQPLPPSSTTSTKSAQPNSTQTPNIADKIYQSCNPYWRARVDETAPAHDIMNVRHILSPTVETAVSKQPSAKSPDALMLSRTRSSRRRDSLTASAESIVMPAPLNRGTFVRPGSS